MPRRYSYLWGAACSGGLLVLSFPGFSLYLLAWVALVPYLIFLLDKPELVRCGDALAPDEAD